MHKHTKFNTIHNIHFCQGDFLLSIALNLKFRGKGLFKYWVIDGFKECNRTTGIVHWLPTWASRDHYHNLGILHLLFIYIQEWHRKMEIVIFWYKKKLVHILTNLQSMWSVSLTIYSNHRILWVSSMLKNTALSKHSIAEISI